MQTYGERSVGLSFNPSGNDRVHQLKALYAQIIDDMVALKQESFHNPERQRLASIAITEAQTAQMWAVKAVTWKDE